MANIGDEPQRTEVFPEKPFPAKRPAPAEPVPAPATEPAKEPLPV
jgi:hypothetical protein